MSDLLAIPKLASITAEFYVGVTKTKGVPTNTQPVSLPVEEKKILVVENVADTGDNLKSVNLHLKKKGASKIKVATICYKP